MSAAVVATGWLTAILAVGSAICGFLAAITDSWVVIFRSSATNSVIRYGMMHLCTGSQCVAQAYVPVSGCPRSRDEVNERYRAIEAFLCIGSAFALLTIILSPMIVLRARYNEYKREEWRAGGRCTALDIELLKASENVVRKRVIGLVFLQLIAFVSLALCLGLFATVYNSFAYCQPFCEYVKKTLSTTDCNRGYTWSLALAALIMTIISALSALILTLFFFRGYDKRFHGIVPNAKGTGEMEPSKAQPPHSHSHHDEQMYQPHPQQTQQYGQSGSSTENHRQRGTEEQSNNSSHPTQQQPQQQQQQKTAASEPIHHDQPQQHSSASNRQQPPQDESRRVQQSQGRDDDSRAPPSRSPQRRPAGDGSRDSSGNQQPPRSTPQRRSVSPQPSAAPSSSSAPPANTQSRSQQPPAQTTTHQQQPSQQHQQHQSEPQGRNQQQQQQDRSVHNHQGHTQQPQQQQQQGRQEPANNRGKNPLDSVGDDHVQSTPPRRERYILEEHEAIILNLQGDDWEYVDSAQLYWSEEQKLYFDPNSTNFYDPQTDQWFDPDTGEWYILMEDGTQQPSK